MLLTTPKTKRSCSLNVQLRAHYMKRYNGCLNTRKRNVHVLSMYSFLQMIYNDSKVVKYPENETFMFFLRTTTCIKCETIRLPLYTPKTKRLCSLNVHVRAYYVKQYECCWIPRKRNVYVLFIYIYVYTTWYDTKVVEYTENETFMFSQCTTTCILYETIPRWAHA